MPHSAIAQRVVSAALEGADCSFQLRAREGRQEGEESGSQEGFQSLTAVLGVRASCLTSD